MKKTFKILKIDHIAIAVNNNNKSKEFFKLLGMDVYNSEYIENQKAKYVKRLRDDSGNVVTSHASLPTVDVILEHDCMIDQYARLLFSNHFPLPERVVNWSPFLSDRVCHKYKILARPL